MHETYWLQKGTIYFRRRSEQTFNVIPGSSILLGLLDPKLSTDAYGFDRRDMERFLVRLAKSFHYDIKLLVNPVVRYGNPPVKGNETHFRVSSQSQNRDYGVTLMNAVNREADLVTKLKSLRNVKHICECGRSFKKDPICSMPAELCAPWGITYGEYERSRMEIDKVYGEVVCKHKARTLSELEYPLFNKTAFLQSVFPFVVRDLNQLETWEQEDLDVVVKSHLHRMGASKVLNVLKQFNFLDQTLIEAQRKFS